MHPRSIASTREPAIQANLERDIVVIGGSAGGIVALRNLLQQLPADFPAAVFVVIHVAPESPALLAGILSRAGPLPAEYARDGDPIRKGRIVIAPPDRHLVLERNAVRLSRGPRENRHRPSIDILFRSAAVAHGARVIGVVLSGMLDDGAAGLWSVKRKRGVAIVQDPADAEFPDMPTHALQTVRVDDCLKLSEIAVRLVELAGTPLRAASAPTPDLAQEVQMSDDHTHAVDALDRFGNRVAYTCPECGGSLWEMKDGGIPRYRCHVGHAYSLHTLAAEQSVRVEAALWAALRGLVENERIARRVADDAQARGSVASAMSHREHALSLARHADTLRAMIDAAIAPAADESPASGS